MPGDGPRQPLGQRHLRGPAEQAAGQGIPARQGRKVHRARRPGADVQPVRAAQQRRDLPGNVAHRHGGARADVDHRAAQVVPVRSPQQGADHVIDIEHIAPLPPVAHGEPLPGQQRPDQRRDQKRRALIRSIDQGGPQGGQHHRRLRLHHAIPLGHRNLTGGIGRDRRLALGFIRRAGAIAIFFQTAGADDPAQRNPRRHRCHRRPQNRHRAGDIRLHRPVDHRPVAVKMPHRCVARQMKDRGRGGMCHQPHQPVMVRKVADLG